MRRSVAVTWHASFSVLAGVLYFFFVLPRWYELTGETSHTLGTVLRIFVGALIGLAALPVVFTLQRTRLPEFRTPRLALGLRTWSIVLHVLAGVLITGAAISEIWLSLDTAGSYLFGVYGAAAAIALLGVFAYYLAFVAELPPPPPKPRKPKSTVNRRSRKQDADDTMDDDDNAADDTVADDAESDQPAKVTAEELTESDDAETLAQVGRSEGSSGGKLRNRRRRLRGGVAVED